MRGATSLAYLLARTSDTIADASSASFECRLQSLDGFHDGVKRNVRPPRWSATLLNSMADAKERRLLECTAEVFEEMQRLPEAERALVREVLGTILSGQRLDLIRFENATAENPVALESDDELEDYAWRVAGCVGEFWTKLGYHTLRSRYSRIPERVMLERGVEFGKGLQLVNILRDLSEDLALGRCYLPVVNPRDTAEILACHARWLSIARRWIAEGATYAGDLCIRRLRAATALPAMIAQETLTSLDGVDWQALGGRIKVPRRRVYQSLAKALFLPPPRLRS